MSKHIQPFTDTDRRIKSPAERLGMSPDAYAAELAAGRKWCWHCQNWHDRDQFGPNRHYADGLALTCRDCMRTYQRQYYRRQKAQRAA